MPTASQHHKKAEINRRFLATISIDDFPDWVVVVAFYTAVHLVEELRAASGEGDSTDHEDRLAYIQHKHPTIHTAYHILQNASMLARYASNAAFFAQFQREVIVERIIGQCLVEVERYVYSRDHALPRNPPS
ncbi:MAG: hypothetical protein ACHRHE_22915 [Tepidisphaerales bacterium]